MKTTRKDFELLPCGNTFAARGERWTLADIVPASLHAVILSDFCRCVRWGDAFTEYVIFPRLRQFGCIKISIFKRYE